MASNGITLDDRLVVVVERKSLADLVSSLISGKLRYALGDVVEDRYSQVFKLDWSDLLQSPTASPSYRSAGPREQPDPLRC